MHRRCRFASVAGIPKMLASRLQPCDLREDAVMDEPGDRAEVAWHTRAGLEHQITLEETANLRLVHESELDPE